MKETRYFYVPSAAQLDQLPEAEATHAVRVLRMQPGDQMMLIDGKGSFHEAEVTTATSHRCFYRILRSIPQEPTWRGQIHLAVAPTKLIDRIEWFAEKATEVGIDRLSFVDCQFSERHVVKTERIEKIVVSAVKQSRKGWMPVISEMTPFRRFVESCGEGRRYIAHCYEEIPKQDLFALLSQAAANPSQANDPVTVMIGPEGDFSIDEVNFALSHGFISVDLGKSRLRTETAALSAVMMMQLTQRIL